MKTTKSVCVLGLTLLALANSVTAKSPILIEDFEGGSGVIPMEGMPFNMQMLFPVTLTLRTTADGLRMFANPVSEIENIYRKEHAWTNTTLSPGQTMLGELSGDLWDIDAEFQIGDAKKFGLRIRDIDVTYSVVEHKLSCADVEASVTPVSGRIRLRVLVDRVSIEIFANDGRIYMPVRAIPSRNASQVDAFTTGGMTTLCALQVWELESIWRRS